MCRHVRGIIAVICRFYAVIAVLCGMYTELQGNNGTNDRFAAMTKLGSAEYPETSLSECLRIADRIRTDFGGEVRRAGLALVLGMSPGGGAFGARLGSMRMWGIIEGRSALRLTQIASNALVETDDETRAMFMSELASSVPFFVELGDRMPSGNSDRAVLAATVQEISEAPLDEVEARLPQIERLLGEVRQYMKPGGRSADANQVVKSETPAVSEFARHVSNPKHDGVPASRIELRYPGAELSVEETADNIDLLVAALTTRKRGLDADGAE